MVSIQVSPNFRPNNPNRLPTNVILISNNNTQFYANEGTLLRSSNNSFNGLLPLAGQEKENRVIYLRDLSSSELEIFLQAIYTEKAGPTSTVGGGNIADFQILARGIQWLPTFGIPVRSVILPHTHIFESILSFAPLYPMEVYAFAGHHDLDELAVAVSPHTLPFELWNIDEELAMEMGVAYFLRLVRLHRGRQTLLKNLLAVGPDLHASTRRCSFEDQQELKDKWYMAIASLIWEIKADITTGLIREKIMTNTSDITCDDCVKARDTRLNAILAEWSMSARSI